MARWVRLEALGPLEVYALLKLRQDVFILEQASLYGDIDGKDPEALHLLVKELKTGELAGVLRLMADDARGRVRIGRVVIAKAARGTGLGRKLMQVAMARAGDLVPGGAIDLSAQAHLEAFYQSLGFETVSDVYIEDGIPHMDMVRPGM